jgi:hypothetical protein
MQDRIYRIVEIFLHRTAGPYIWVVEGSLLRSPDCPQYQSRLAAH